MIRPAVREFMASGTGVTPGEVLVATQIGDQERGGLPSPAAPLIAGTLRGKGRRVRLGPVPSYGDDAGDTVLFVATCQQRDGTTAAIAAGADATDRVAAAAAHGAIADWSAVFGTRRLLAAASPWCGGADRTLAAAQRAVADPRTLHVYGQLAASREAIADLVAAGAIFVASLAEVPDGGTVMLPAHGVAAELRAQATARGLDVIDATCPLVARLHADAAKAVSRGDDLILIGPPGYPVAAGIIGAAPGRVSVAATPASTASLRAADSRRVSYLLQPGTPVEDSAPVAGALRSRYPALRGPNPDGFCYAASDRAQTVRAIAAACDVILVLGAADAPDTRQLSAQARGHGARAQVIGEIAEMTPAMLAGASAVGIAESTSASQVLAAQLTAALSGLGPLSVMSRQVSTQILGAPEWPA